MPGTIVLLRVIGVVNLIAAGLGGLVFASTESYVLAVALVVEGIVAFALFFGLALIAETLVYIERLLRAQSEIEPG